MDKDVQTVVLNLLIVFDRLCPRHGVSYRLICAKSTLLIDPGKRHQEQNELRHTIVADGDQEIVVVVIGIGVFRRGGQISTFARISVRNFA